jgi:hypothetical protein
MNKPNKSYYRIFPIICFFSTIAIIYYLPEFCFAEGEGKTETQSSHVAQFVEHLAWPITVLLIIVFFHSQIKEVMKRLTELIKKAKTLRVNFGSGSLEIGLEKSENMLGAMFGLVQGMTQDERRLFQIILEQPPKGLELTGAFKRSSQYHKNLRWLRDRNLIQPTERGHWQPKKHARVTRIGHAILGVDELKKIMLSDGTPSWWKSEYEGPNFRAESL